MDSSATYATMSDDRGGAAAARNSATDMLRASAAQREQRASAAAAAASAVHSHSASSSPDSSPPHSLASSTASGSYSSSHGDDSLLAGYSTHGEFEEDSSALQQHGRARAASSSSSAAAAAASSSSIAAASSSSSSSFLETADDPSAGFGGEMLFDDGIGAAPAAAVDGSSSSSGVAAIDWIARSMRRCSCSARDIRVLLMLLPLTTVVLFATNQKTAAFVLLGFTVVVGAALIARIVQIMGVRRARRQQYGMLDPAAAEEGNGEIAMVSLGAALGLSPASGSGRSRGGQGRSAARYHSSLLHPAARHNPTALRLAMADRDFGPNDYDLLLRLDSEHQAQVFTGIPASQIQRLPTWRVPKATPGASASAASKENVCAVCLEDKAEGEMVRTLPCLHAFHVPCIDPWLQSHVKCPVCQHKVIFPD